MEFVLVRMMDLDNAVKDPLPQLLSFISMSISGLFRYEMTSWPKISGCPYTFPKTEQVKIIL